MEGSVGTEPNTESPIPDNNDQGWTLVNRKAKKARSLDSLKGTSSQSLVNGNEFVIPEYHGKGKKPATPPINNKLPTASDTKAQLSQKEIEHEKHQKGVHIEEPSNADKGEGPSNKGKNPDLCNWAGAGLPKTEMDIEAQCEALANWELVRKLGGQATYIEDYFTLDEDIPQTPKKGDPPSALHKAAGIWFDPVSTKLQKELEEVNTRCQRITELLRHHQEQAKSNIDQKPSIEEASANNNTATAVSIVSGSQPPEKESAPPQDVPRIVKPSKKLGPDKFLK
ncbi:hypothetical protein JAAARDRAFT_194785 [Jaapia argillacea MUCL 33604]|uniref:Uncharacterized protein n=1 Tax=Jaapia argillacea MUCL 33604 TaxID=933084 RepID=A0A067PSN0_9AGAM|nr:hypothetical protein JAAARDRAFT_194785 [Jaapia argillacea MUCL 33604]